MQLWNVIAPAYRIAAKAPIPGYQRLYRFIRAHISGKVLEVGCGPGNVTRNVAQAAGHIDAIDAAEKMIAEASKRAPANVTFHCADATDLPFEEDYFDSAFAVNILHIVPNPQAVLEEVARILKPGGAFVAATFTRDDSIRGRLATRLTSRLRGTNVFAWDDAAYRALFIRHGWNVTAHTVIRSVFQLSVVVAKKPE